MENYLSQRALAANLKTDSATISKIAASLKLGAAGSHPNSAKTFSAIEAETITAHYFSAKEGQLRNQSLCIEAEILNQARTMSRLASLASACGGSCAPQLRDLAAVVARIDAGLDGKPNLRTAQGKTVFLNALNPHRADLREAIANVHGKI